MQALAHIPPEVWKRILELDGWTVLYEDSYNWLLEKDGKEPVALPKRIKLVPFEIHEHFMAVSEIHLARYFELLEAAGYKN